MLSGRSLAPSAAVLIKIRSNRRRIELGISLLSLMDVSQVYLLSSGFPSISHTSEIPSGSPPSFFTCHNKHRQTNLHITFWQIKMWVLILRTLEQTHVNITHNLPIPKVSISSKYDWVVPWSLFHPFPDSPQLIQTFLRACLTALQMRCHYAQWVA